MPLSVARTPHFQENTCRAKGCAVRRERRTAAGDGGSRRRAGLHHIPRWEPSSERRPAQAPFQRAQLRDAQRPRTVHEMGRREINFSPGVASMQAAVDCDSHPGAGL